MIEVLLTAIPSLCWLFFRCYQLFQTPADQLARQLNVDIPRTPVVCVDQLGSDHASIHWDIETSPDENVFFVLLVNGKDAGTLAANSARLSNLLPDTLYVIQILAVNAISNFRSQSSALFIHTLPANFKAKDSSLEIDSFPFPIAKEVELPCNVSEEDLRNCSLDLLPEDVDKISNEKVLSRNLFLYLNELARVKKETKEAACHQKEEEAQLKESIECFKRELNEGSDLRAKKDLDLKDLEKKKNALTFTKLKLTKQLKSYESHRNMHVSKISEMKSKVAKLQEKHHHMINTNETEKSKTHEQVAELNFMINDIKAEINSIEESVKGLTSERKNLSTLVQSLQPLVNQFVSPPNLANTETQSAPQSSAEIFTRDGLLTKLGLGVLQKIYELRPDWEPEINKELEHMITLENSWKAEFRATIQRFVTIHNSIEIARSNKDPGYEPNCLTEYTASVEFGGFSNALSKFKKKSYLTGDGSGPSSPSPDGSFDNWYGHFGHVYEDQSANATTNSLNNVGVSASINAAGIPSQTQSVSLLVASGNGQLDQYAPLYLGNQMDQAQPTNDYMGDVSFGAPQVYAGSNYENNNFAESAPFIDQRMYNDNGLYAENRSYGDSTANLATPQQMQYLQSDYDPQIPLPELGLSIPHTSMQQYAQNIRQSFPCEDPVYSVRSPTPENGFLQPSMNTLWQNSSQASFRDQMRPFLGLPLLPASAHMDLAMPQLQLTTLPNDNHLFNSLLLSSSTSQLSNNIWLDRPMTTSYSHNRNISGGSLLWRNDLARPEAPSLGLMSEFLPFASVPGREEVGDEEKVPM